MRFRSANISAILPLPIRQVAGCLSLGSVIRGTSIEPGDEQVVSKCAECAMLKKSFKLRKALHTEWLATLHF